MSKRTLIIGAAGYLGQKIAKRLTEMDVKVIGLASRAPEDIAFERFHIGRTELISALVSAIDGCDTVVFAGGSTRPGSKMASIHAELSAEAGHLIDVAELCAAHGVKKFIFLSSGGAIYGRTLADKIGEDHPTLPISNYGLGKLVSEHGLRMIANNSSMCTVSLRVSNPYGLGQIVKGAQGFVAALVNAARTSAPLEVWGDGSIIRDFIYVDDVVSAITTTIMKDLDSCVINIGSGQGVSINQLIETARNVWDTEFGVIYKPGRGVDVPKVVLDVRRAKETLCWEPKCSLERGLSLINPGKLA